MFTTDVEGDHARQALADVVVTTGVDTPSLRSIARAAGVSAQTLLYWFGSKSLLHVRVLDVLTARRAGRIGTDLFLDDVEPDSAPWTVQQAERDRADLRLRLALGEVARTDQNPADGSLADGSLADALGRAVETERAAIRRCISARRSEIAARRSDSAPCGETAESLDEASVELLHAVLLGLWSRLCDRHPMTGARARELWAIACQALAD